MSDWNDDQMLRLAMEREEDGMLQRAENERECPSCHGDRWLNAGDDLNERRCPCVPAPTVEMGDLDAA